MTWLQWRIRSLMDARELAHKHGEDTRLTDIEVQRILDILEGLENDSYQYL